VWRWVFGVADQFVNVDKISKDDRNLSRGEPVIAIASPSTDVAIGMG
jgi:hypothetical protein